MTPRMALQEIRDLLEELPSELGEVPTPELVRLGADLGTLTARLKVLTESVKDTLRAQVSPVPGQHILKGPGALCQVTVQEAMPTLRNEVDLVALRRALGADFERLFKVQELVTPREEFAEALQGVEESKIAIILGAVDLTNHKPRMSFQRTP